MMRVRLEITMTKDERRELMRRAGPLIIVILIHILGVIGLIMLAPEYNPLKKLDREFTLLDLKPPPPPVQEKKAKIVSNPRAGGAPRKAAEPVGPPPPLHMLVMDSRTFASSNIGALPQAPAGPVVADNSGSPGGKGEGPNGEKLYNAEWYREPTEAETSPYFKNVHAGGWGEIACRTIEHWHVEDCQEIDESPPGSGIARAARQAAWQFLVRPPRVGGKVLIGSWVRIRYTLTMMKGASDPGRYGSSQDPPYKPSQSGSVGHYGPVLGPKP